jgi:hypothetical protein
MRDENRRHPERCKQPPDHVAAIIADGALRPSRQDPFEERGFLESRESK